MRGHAHDWHYVETERRVCDCEAVEILTGAGDWVPVEWAVEHLEWEVPA